MTLPGPAARRLAPEHWMQAAWMHADAARRVLDVLGPLPALFVGGCVRDALLGQVPADIDIATPLVPNEVLRRLRQAGLKAIPTGIAHGTVTALLSAAGGMAQFEITTLRRDVATDGRHAEVAFGTDWQVDAERRDFTINALYADADGAIYDPVGGLADLDQGRVRFIGDASARVAEDYLRVLRFFRFHARFASGVADAAAMAACGAAAQSGALERLSGERVREELVKILGLPRAVEALGLMQQSGVLDALLPGHRFAAALFERLTALSNDAWLRLAALLPGQSEAAIARLKLSRAQQHRMEVLTAPAPFDWAALSDETGWPALFYSHGAEYCRDHAILMALENPERLDLLPRLIEAAARYRRPVFPLRGADLLKHGVRAGPGVSLILKELEAWWRDGGFNAGREACLTEMRERVRFAEDAPPEEAQPKPPPKPPGEA
ncbi:CCA tRNA nucleotidyltransferase [Ferrovibrio sp.]|uniref:CCA tRNA nucleotidyltransferase n=1 Tax=Ferrovibrio sp. TaxID=1917215 RepID=UPI003D12270C